MTLNITAPQISSKNSSTKDKIILVLGREFPLTAREIFNRLKKEFSSAVSYQATHKLLNQLVEERVLLKEGKSYSLNKDWIKQVKTFGSNLEDSYLKKPGLNYLQELEKHGTVNVTLIGIRETARFLIDGFFRLPNPQKKPNIALFRNVYSIIGLDEMDYSGLKETIGEWHALSSENNPVDKMFADTLSKYGMKVKLGVKDITKNPALADQIREEYMKYFKEGKK